MRQRKKRPAQKDLMVAYEIPEANRKGPGVGVKSV